VDIGKEEEENGERFKNNIQTKDHVNKTMLSKVLTYLKTGGDANTATIARKLGIEQATVVLLLDQLVKLGYLERIEDFEKNADFCTQTKCTGCTRLTSCKPILKAKYKLVQK